MRTVLTLICAVYKVRAYLPELVDSLIRGANHPEVELLFIHDASPDDSLAVLQRLLVERGSEIAFRFRIIDRPLNGGLAAARNTGLDAADGEYIGVVDSDDVIDGTYFAVLRPWLIEGRWDAVEFDHTEFSVSPQPRDASRAVTTRPANQLTPYLTGFFSWRRVFRAPLLQGLRYPEGRLFEDVRFVAEAYARCHKSVHVSACLLHYRRRPGSITASRDARYADLLINLIEGTKAVLPLHDDRSLLMKLATRKAVVVLLKGSRIRSVAERQRFFLRCDPAWADLRQLVAGQGDALVNRAWWHLGALWVRLQRGWAMTS